MMPPLCDGPDPCRSVGAAQRNPRLPRARTNPPLSHALPNHVTNPGSYEERPSARHRKATVPTPRPVCTRPHQIPSRPTRPPTSARPIRRASPPQIPVVARRRGKRRDPEGFSTPLFVAHTQA
jgi:hypothetical protein